MGAKKVNTKLISILSMSIAVVFVFTILIAISIPATRGFWNIGETGVYIVALLFGPVIGAVAGGVGSALADLFLGYAIYAPGTLIIKGAEGFIVGYLYSLMQRKSERKRTILFYAMLLTLLVILSTVFVFYIFGGEGGEIVVELYSEMLKGGVSFSLPFFVIIAIEIIIGGIALILLYVGRETPVMIFSCLIGGIIMVLGYFLYETLILGSSIALIEVIPNFMQVLIGIVLGVPVVIKLKEMGLVDRYKRFVGEISQ